MSGLVDRHLCLPGNENISGTIDQSGDAVTSLARRAPPGCGYVVAAGWRYGDPSPFCDAPAVPGSSYCAAHRALCAVRPTSPEGRRILAAQRRAAAGEAALAGRPGSGFDDPEPLDAEPDRDDLAAVQVPVSMDGDVR